METLIRILFLLDHRSFAGFLLRALGKSIAEQRRNGESVKEGFGLSLALLALFLTAWLGHALSPTAPGRPTILERPEGPNETGRQTERPPESARLGGRRR